MKIIFLIVMLFTASILLLPEENGEYSLTMCLQIALREHPAVAAAAADVKAAHARVVQATSLPQPDLSYDSDLQTRILNFRKSAESYFGISQSLPWPGRILLQGKIARQEVRETESNGNRVRQELIAEVKTAFFSLLLSEQLLALCQEDLALAADFLVKATLKYESGDVPQIEMMKARVEKARAENELLRARGRANVAVSALNILLGHPAEMPLKLKGKLQPLPLALDAGRLNETALNLRPEIVQAKLALRRFFWMKRQARERYLPDLALGMARHRIAGEADTWDVTLSMQFPLFFWQRWKGEIAEASALQRRAAAELDMAERAVRLETTTALQNLMTAQERIRFFEEHVLREAESVYEKTMFSYQEGEIGYIELIESRRTLIETKKSYAESLFEYQAALCELEKAVGQSLMEVQNG